MHACTHVAMTYAMFGMQTEIITYMVIDISGLHARHVTWSTLAMIFIMRSPLSHDQSHLNHDLLDYGLLQLSIAAIHASIIRKQTKT